MSSIIDFARGVIVETKTQSLTGDLFYSDKSYYDDDMPVAVFCEHPLNELARIPVLGIVAGITRMALAVIHSIGHLFMSLVTLDKGHLYHAAKGGCEFLRGFIEAIPFAGRLFARSYYEDGLWWMIKIYNPNSPDTLDRHMGLWKDFKLARPTGYVVA